MDKDLKTIIKESVIETTYELGLLGIYGFVTQVLWNTVVAEILSLPTLTWLNALSLLIVFNVFTTFSQLLNKTKSK